MTIPLSYNGFGPTAILIMLICLIVSQVFKYVRTRHEKKKRIKIINKE